MHADPQRAIFKGKTLQYTEEKMAATLWRGGGLPLGLPDLKSTEAVEALVAQVDGLLLQGGADVSPTSYGETPIRPEWSGDRIRDEYEIELVRAAVAQGKPVLGICRGVQLLNVARGGTLYQDVETQVEGSLAHRDWHRYEDVEHTVSLESGSWVHEVYGADELLVNTIHHQAVKDLAPGMRITSRAPDGIVEAIEDIRPDGDERGPARWLAGVQWHPEWLDGSPEGGPHRSDGDRLFAAFVRTCARGLQGHG